MKCEHHDKGFCLHDGYLCSHCKTSKKDEQASVPNANRKQTETSGSVIREFEIKGEYTCLTPCPDRKRIKIGSVNCKQCWKLLVYDGEKKYVKCRKKAEALK